MDNWLFSTRFYDCLSCVAGGGRPLRDSLRAGLALLQSTPDQMAGFCTRSKTATTARKVGVRTIRWSGKLAAQTLAKTRPQ